MPPKVSLLVLVRHAQPAVDRATPRERWSLTDAGVEASARLAERLRPIGVDLVVSSTETKAIETGRIVGEALGVTFHTADGLHEHEREDVPFLSDDVFEASLRGVFEQPAKVVFGTESGRATETRFAAAVDAVVRLNPGARPAIVSHGTVLSLHLAARYGLDGYSTWKRLGMPAYVVVERRTKSVVDVVGNV